MDVPEETKKRLRPTCAELDLTSLHHEILLCQEQLDEIAKRRQSLVIKKCGSYAYISGELTRSAGEKGQHASTLISHSKKALTRRGFFVVRRCPVLPQDRFVLALRLDVSISIMPAVEQLVLEDPIYCLLAPRFPRGGNPSLSVELLRNF